MKRYRILFRRERVDNDDVIEYVGENGRWTFDHHDAARFDIDAAVEKHNELSEYYAMGWMVFTPGGQTK